MKVRSPLWGEYQSGLIGVRKAADTGPASFSGVGQHVKAALPGDRRRIPVIRVTVVNMLLSHKAREGVGLGLRDPIDGEASPRAIERRPETQ
jgi:hypothetical protein